MQIVIIIEILDKITIITDLTKTEIIKNLAIIAIIIHAKNKLINFKTAIPFLISGVIFSVLGSLLANSTNTLTLKVLFGIFLVMLGLFQGGSLFIFKNDKKQ